MLICVVAISKVMLRPVFCAIYLREVYSKWERRAPLCPWHVEELVKNGVKVLVQPSSSRVFGDDEYTRAGAIVTSDLSKAQVILGVKQVPVATLMENKTYLFFSHTVKGQPENMALLEECLRKQVRLVDYECITEGGLRNGKRLIAFGAWAGRAGMINAIRGLGERLLALEYSSPFLQLGSSYMYASYEEARRAVANVGAHIRSHGIPKQLAPMVFIFTSNGNASQGAQEVFSLLPHQWVRVEDLPHLSPDTGKLFGCIVTTKDHVRHREGAEFDPCEYHEQGSLKYESLFHTIVAPYASVIVNCMYWDHRYPRLLSTLQMKALSTAENCKLIAVADVSCDVRGSIEFLEKTSTIERPFYRVDVATNRVDDSLDGPGILMMGVDILPSELPREASQHFGDLLCSMIQPLLHAHARCPLEEQASVLPADLHNAIITNQGEMMKGYEYILKISQHRRLALLSKTSHHDTSKPPVTRHVALRGHIFDTNLINKAFDRIEEMAGWFELQGCRVQQNSLVSGRKSVSEAILMICAHDPQSLDCILEGLFNLVYSVPESQATLTELQEHDASERSSFGTPVAGTHEDHKDPAAMSSETLPDHDLYQRPKNVVCLGAGLVSEPLVEFLSRDCNLSLQVVSGVSGQAQSLADRLHRRNITAWTLDVMLDIETVNALITSADCVISLLPASMHASIAETCIRARTHLVTASYVTEEMQGLHTRALQAGVTILCEMGLDPGMDHMSAMQMIGKAKASGSTILSFASWCGGLPSPEAANNPLRYKFSWSPQGALSALQSSARFLRNGNAVVVPAEQLLLSVEPVNFLPAFSFEALPNRDSLRYASLYGIPEAKTVFRGTLRYAGFASIMNCIQKIGLLDSSPADAKFGVMEQRPRSWDDLMKSGLVQMDDSTSPDAIRCLQWLGVWSGKRLQLQQGWSVRQEFEKLLTDRLSYQVGERDMVVMHHEIGVLTNNGDAQTHTCTLVGYGKERGPTFMSTAVGLTAAVGVKLLLAGELPRTGVVHPTIPEVFEPALQMLQQEGIKWTHEQLTTGRTSQDKGKL